jgi:electron transfer flavoprotein beta subunit
MRIVVAIKQVLDPHGFTVNRKAEKIFVNREEYIINPADKCALEAALQLKDATGAEVIVLCGGPERANEAIRQAWAMGADRGIHLTDNLFAGADGLVAAKLLAAAIHKLGDVDLVFTGDRALDTGAGEVGPRLAEALGWPHILAAHKVEVNDEMVKVIAAEEKKFVALETQRLAVVIVATRANVPRYANAARVINSYQKWNPETWNAADLGLTETDLKVAVEKRGQAFPPERQPGTILGSADELVGMLKRQRVI